MSLPMGEVRAPLWLIMRWIQVSASQLFRIIITAISDNTDQLTI